MAFPAEGPCFFPGISHNGAILHSGAGMSGKKTEKRTWQRVFKPSGGVAQLLILLLIGGLLYASSTGHLDALRDFLDDGRFSISIGPYELTAYKILKSVLIATMLFWVTAIVSSFGEKRIGAIRHIKRGTKVLLAKFFQILVYLIAFLIGLDLLGIELTTLAVFGGALGIGIGFGLQKITSNFISGLILLMEKTINQDDMIELQGGFSGFVRSINARFTLMETLDGKDIMIPNEDLITSQVVNWTYSNKRGRVEVNIRVAHDTDLDRAQELILEAAREHPRCMLDPEPGCFLNTFNESSIDFLLYFWVSDVTEGRLRPRSEVMFSIWRKFKAEGIEIPFPQRDLHLRSAEGWPPPKKPKTGK